MRKMKGKVTMQRGTMLLVKLDRHKMMMRRSANRNAHIITPHGKVMAGRKGRKV